MSNLDTSSLSPNVLLGLSSALIAMTAYGAAKHGMVGAMIGGITTANFAVKELLPDLKVEGVELPHIAFAILVGYKYAGLPGAAIFGSAMATKTIIPVTMSAMCGVCAHKLIEYRAPDALPALPLQLTLSTASALIALEANQGDFALAGTALGGAICGLPCAIGGGILGAGFDLFNYYHSDM